MSKKTKLSKAVMGTHKGGGAGQGPPDLDHDTPMDPNAGHLPSNPKKGGTKVHIPLGAKDSSR